MRPRRRSPPSISTGSPPSPEPELELELGRFEAAVGVRLGAQVAQQVELQPPCGGAHARLLRGQPELGAALAQLLEQDALRVREVGVRHAPLARLLAQAAVGVLEHLVRI